MPVLSYINVSHACNKFPSSVTGSICCERPWSGKIAWWAALHALALSVRETFDELLFKPKLYHPPALIPDQKSRWHRMPILSPDICALPCIVMYVSKDKKKIKKKFVCAHQRKFGRKRKIVRCNTYGSRLSMHDETLLTRRSKNSIPSHWGTDLFTDLMWLWHNSIGGKEKEKFRINKLR